MATRIVTRTMKGLLGTMGALSLGALSGACENRPAVAETATTKASFVDDIRQAGVDKVDILFAIDNSASMGDKQAYLAKAVPDLVTRLVTPNCVDPTSGTVFGASDANGNCAQGQLEFPPVHDLHLGIVSTSLGERGGDQCPVAGGPTSATTPGGSTVVYSYDDRGELVQRGGNGETPVADAGNEHFLSWFPTTSPANAGASPSAGSVPLSDVSTFVDDFSNMVTGVGVYGCGIESQLESWYRFLIQPDPYDQIVVSNGQATWQGVDQTILQERHDFLRPDSLVAVIVLSDENDSEIDVRSYGGQGYKFLSGGFRPLHATSACETDPGSAECTSCGFAGDAAASDPSCTCPAGGVDAGAGGAGCKTDYSDASDWGYNTNLRHVHMKQKYGLDPQFPIQRYVLGLTSPMIPDRRGEYPTGSQSYQGTTNCTNPLFAASLPDGTSTDADTLCNLPKGTRSPSLVFYAHIGGVPHQLLQQDPTDPDSPQKDALTDSDWVKVLGRDPLHYDTTGIDPHMVESYQPRPGLPGPSSASGADPINGHEWITNQAKGEMLPVDREYACTFKLEQPLDCTNGAVRAAGCDCPGGLSPEDTPPVCDTTVQTTQDYAKAYPTIRELLVGKLMGDQGIVSSLCPIHTSDNAMGTDPLYGYRPAMTAILNRLKSALAASCVPQPLAIDPSSGTVPCLVLVTLPTGSTSCDPKLGMSAPDGQILQPFVDEQHQTWMMNGGAASGQPDPATLTVCEMGQLTGSALAGGTCATSAEKGWCYVTGSAAGACEQEVLFSPGSVPHGALVTLQCMEAATTAQ